MTSPSDRGNVGAHTPRGTGKQEWRLRHERKTTYSFMRGEGVVMTMHLSDWERDQMQDLMAVANLGAQTASPVPSGLDAVRKVVSVSSYDVTLRAKKECSDVDWCDGYLHGAMAFLEPIWEIVGVEGDSFVPGPDATGGALAHAKDLLHEIDKVGVPIEDIREWLAEIIARLEYDALASPEVAEPRVEEKTIFKCPPCDFHGEVPGADAVGWTCPKCGRMYYSCAPSPPAEPRAEKRRCPTCESIVAVLTCHDPFHQGTHEAVEPLCATCGDKQMVPNKEPGRFTAWKRCPDCVAEDGTWLGRDGKRYRDGGRHG